MQPAPAEHLAPVTGNDHEILHQLPTPYCCSSALETAKADHMSAFLMNAYILDICLYK